MNKIKLFSVLKFSFPYFALLCTVVCLFLTIPQNPIHPHYWGDSAVYEYVAKMMLNGQTLYKDVFDHKGPLVYWFHMLGYAIYPMYGNWFIKLILMFLTLSYAFHLTKQHLSIPLALGLIILLFLTTPNFCTLDNSEALGLLPVLYIMSFTSKYINHQKLNAFDFFMTGLMCITLSFLKLIYLAIPFVLLLYILIDAITRNSAKNIKNIFICYSLGFLIPLIITLGIFYTKDALSDFIDANITFNSQYTKHYQTNGNSSFLEILIFFIKMPASVLALISMMICYAKRSMFNKTKQTYITLLSLTFIFNLLIISLPLNAHANYIFILYPLILGLTTLALKAIAHTPLQHTLITIGILYFAHTFYLGYQKQNLMYEYLSNEYKEMSQQLNQYISKEDTLAVISRRIPNELLYLYMDHPSAIKYPVTFSIIKVAPEKIQTETRSKKLKWIITDNIHAYKDFLDKTQYSLVYKNIFIYVYKNNNL